MLNTQVARRFSPEADAKAVLEIRAAVGQQIVLRADANRMWTVDQALQFADAAREAGLEVCSPFHGCLMCPA